MLLAVSRRPSGGPVPRQTGETGPFSNRRFHPRLMNILGECSSEIEKGAIVIVEESRYRVHRLPIA